MKASNCKAMTPRSIMNQRKAVESRGIKSKTPVTDDENKRPGSVTTTTTTTPGTPTSQFMWKSHGSRREGITPLGLSGKLNRKPASTASSATPSTPTRATPSKQQQTPTRTDKAILFEFEHDLLITPCHNDNAVAISHTASIGIEHSPSKPHNNGNFNRSRSASSLTRVKKSDKMRMRRSVSEARLPIDSLDSNIDSEDGELSRIAVGVRIRPLQNREYGNTLMVEGNEVKIASDLGSLHSFTLDHVFGPTTSQEDIFNTMVKPLVDSAFQGYNACLFAYGQTGSGKSYSMMGVDSEVDGIGDNTGIIPRFCQEIIERVSKENDEAGGDRIHVSTTVEVSYLEVYNEKIRDLLIPPPSQPLRVREHPVYGPYVADLSKHTVNTFNDIQHWIREGNKQRMIAATEMNEKSSRSHSLFMVLLTQSIIQDDEGEGWTNEHTRRSQINLVDLAGSERIAHSSVSSDRLREGVSINRSLMTLGKVISALVDKRSFVPYRESVLTWLLKESLGGNSRTGMLATVSPCSSHQDETIATLRYATQARSILNTVRVNESPQNKIIRELRAEIERLKEFVDGGEHSRPLSRMTSPMMNKCTEEITTLRSEMKSLSDIVKDLKAKLLESEKRRLEAEEREFASNQRESEIDQMTEKYKNLEDKFKEMVMEHETCLNLCNSKEQAVEAFKRRAQTAQNEKCELQGKLDLSEKEVKNLCETLEDLMRQKNEWSGKYESLERTLKECKCALETRKTKENELVSRAENAERDLEQCKERLSSFENESKHRRDQTASIEKDVEKWKGKIESLKMEMRKLSRALDEEKSHAEFWKEKSSRLEVTESKLKEREEELLRCKQMLMAKQKEMDEWFSKKDDMERQLTETGYELDEARNDIKTISVQVEATSPQQDFAMINVSIQTSMEESEEQQVSKYLAAEKKEYIKLKKKVLEKRKKLQSLNSELMKIEKTANCESENRMEDQNGYGLEEAMTKIVDLENQLRTKTSEMEEAMSELELLRELEVRYKEMLDRSLHDNEEAWKKKYSDLNDYLKSSKEEADGLKRQLIESQEQIRELIDRLSESNLDRQILVKANNQSESKQNTESLDKKMNDLQQKLDQSYRTVEALERKSTDLQLKLDQKNNLILELEKVTNKAKEELIKSQAYANAGKKKCEVLESSLKESKQNQEENSLKIEELENQMKDIQNELRASEKHIAHLEDRLGKANETNSTYETNLREKDDKLTELHNQLLSADKMLQQQMSLKFEQLKTLQSQESAKKEELEEKDAVTVENIRYKTELESAKEKLNRKKKRLDEMKSRIDQLECMLVSTVRESVERKNLYVMKTEHAKLYDYMLNTSYIFHWEFLLRKARTYAHKYHIPYEFEKWDGSTAVVRHLLYNAKSYWFRIDFKHWFDNIEKNDRWCRELDENMPWEVDFGNYYKIPNEKPGAQCPLEESACDDIQLYCCKPGLICPSVWKRTIVHRHLNGLLDDVKCLLIYFKNSKNEDVIEQLRVISNLAEQIQDNLSSKS